MMSPTSTTKIPSRVTAFTLVELLLVVTIIGALAAVAVPRFAGSFDYLKTRSAAYNVAATLEHAQALSIIEERRLRVIVDENGARCSLRDDDFVNVATPVRPLKYTLPDGVRIENIDFESPFIYGRSYIGFRPGGDCDRCVLLVSGRSGDVFEVAVGCGVGNVRVHRAEKTN